MIRHVVLFRFAPDVAEQERADLLAELASLPDRFPAMRRFALGANRSDRDDRFGHAFSVEFDDLDALRAYLTSDEHETFVRDRFRPLVAERAIASWEA
ncbi:MAG: Dabb family protein [Acidimicrobiia bacterium]